MQCTMTHMFHMSLMSNASSGACEQGGMILKETISGMLVRIHPDRQDWPSAYISAPSCLACRAQGSMSCLPRP